MLIILANIFTMIVLLHGSGYYLFSRERNLFQNYNLPYCSCTQSGLNSRQLFTFIEIKMLFRRSASELPQKPQIVLKQQPDIGDAVFPHSEPFDAEAERPAGIFFAVDSDGVENIRVNHTAAADLDPPFAAVFTHSKSTSALGSVKGKKLGRNAI